MKIQGLNITSTARRYQRTQESIMELWNKQGQACIMCKEQNKRIETHFNGDKMVFVCSPCINRIKKTHDKYAEIQEEFKTKNIWETSMNKIRGIL